MNGRAPEPPKDWPPFRDDGRTPNRPHEFQIDHETGCCVICGWAEAVHFDYEFEARAPHAPPAESFIAQKINGEWVRCVEAQASRPAPPLDWQPIETAPKDGTLVLITNGTFVLCSRFIEGAWYEMNNDPTDPWGHPQYEGGVTHWMPLPAPPAAHGEKS